MMNPCVCLSYIKSLKQLLHVCSGVLVIGMMDSDLRNPLILVLTGPGLKAKTRTLCFWSSYAVLRERFLRNPFEPL